MKIAVLIAIVALLVAVVGFLAMDRNDKLAHDQSLSEQKQSRRGE